MQTMMNAMLELRVSRKLGSISDRSCTLREFQSFMEGTYFQRSGSEGLVQVANENADRGSMVVAKAAPADGASAALPRRGRDQEERASRSKRAVGGE